MPDKNRITKTGPTPIISGTNAGGADGSGGTGNSGSAGGTNGSVNSPANGSGATGGSGSPNNSATGSPKNSNNSGVKNSTSGASGAASTNSNQKPNSAAGNGNGNGNSSTNNPSNADSKAIVSEIISGIEGSENILIALSAAPSVDELAAAIGFYLYLDRSGKHATVVYSGAIPRSLEYLHPEEIFEKTTDTLQDLVISLDKEKADHLRYKLEGDFVKIYITPYRSKVSSKDLVYSYGDYNVDLAILLKAESENNLDPALKDGAQIFKEAAVVNITNEAPAKIGQLEWSNPRASSISEMVAELMTEMKTEVKMNAEEATALLTGIIFVTDHFSNRNATSKTLQVASRLMEAGGNQQVVSANLELDKAPAPIIKTSTPEKKPADEEIQDLNQGSLELGGSMSGRLEIKRAAEKPETAVGKQDKTQDVTNNSVGLPNSAPAKAEASSLQSENSPKSLSGKTELSSVSESVSKDEKSVDESETKRGLSGEKDKPKDAPLPNKDVLAPDKDASRPSPSRPGATSFATAETLTNASLEPWGKGPAEEEYKELNADLSAAASSLASNAGVETVPEEKPVLQIDEDKTLPPNELANKIEDELSDKPEVVIQPPSGFGEDNGSSKFGQMLAEAISSPTPGAMSGGFGAASNLGATSSGFGASSGGFGAASGPSGFGSTSGSFGATPGATTFGATSTAPLTSATTTISSSSTTNPSPMPVVAALPVPEKSAPASVTPPGSATGFAATPSISPLPATSPVATTSSGTPASVAPGVATSAETTPTPAPPAGPALGAITPLPQSPTLSSVPSTPMPSLPTTAPLNNTINGTPLPNPLEDDADLLPPPPVPPVDLSSVMPTSPDVVNPGHAVPPLTPPTGGFGGVASPFGPPTDLGVITTNRPAVTITSPAPAAATVSATTASTTPADPGAFKIPGM